MSSIKLYVLNENEPRFAARTRFVPCWHNFIKHVHEESQLQDDMFDAVYYRELSSFNARDPGEDIDYITFNSNEDLAEFVMRWS